jgi:hypothetical protein
MRQNFIRILERYGVDLIICGHSHDYERSYLLKNYFGTEATFNVATHAVSSSSAKYDGSTNSCPYLTAPGKVNHGTVYVVAVPQVPAAVRSRVIRTMHCPGHLTTAACYILKWKETGWMQSSFVEPALFLTSLLF